MTDQVPSTVIYDCTAAAYDLLHRSDPDVLEHEVSRIEELIRRFAPDARSLLDVACGTGVHLSALRRSFDEIPGVDASAGMLVEARTQMDAPLVEGDMRTFSFGRQFDAVICVFSSIGYMTTTADLDAAVANMARHLNDHGVLLIEGWVLPELWNDNRPPLTMVAERGSSRVARMTKATRNGDLTALDMHWLISDGGPIAYVREVHELRLHSRADYERAIVQAGLRFEHAEGLTGRGLYVGLRE